MQLLLKKMRGLLTIMLAIFFLLPMVASADTKPMSAERAFKLVVQFDGSAPAALQLQWQMAAGYYLYRDSLHVKIDDKPVAQLSLPPAELKKDVNNGQEAVYPGKMSLMVPYNKSATISHLTVQYQGCSKSGFCYPPMVKHYNVDIGHQQITLVNSPRVSSFSLNSLLTDQHQANNTLGTQHFLISLAIFFGLGILLAFTPCVLPMVPILVSIIAGQKKRSEFTSNKHVFSLCLAYVLGVAATYALVGIVAALLGSSIQVWLQKPLFILLGSAIFVLLALSLFGLFDLYLFKGIQNAIANWTRHLKGGSYIGVFSMGVLSVLLISPCTTAPLVGVLLYIGQTGDLLLGASTLFAMGIGMGVPLLMVGMSADKWLPRRGPWMEWVKKLFGVLMIVMAAWMVTRIGIFNVAKPVAQEQSFTTVQNLEEFDQQLALSSQSRRPIILDFYADWCESCVSMEKNVFRNQTVTGVLSPFTMLRVNLSANTPTDEMLMKHFNVIAPPTVLFFDEQGKEVDSKRIVGEVDASEFIQRIDTFIAAGCGKSATC